MANFRTINLADIYNAADQTNTNRMRNQLMQMEMQKAQRGEQEEQALRGAYAFTPEGGLDEQTTLANLYKVAPQKAYEFQQGVTKSRSEQAKLERENASADVTNRVAKSKYLRDVLAGVTDQPSYENALQEANSLGASFMTQNAPAQFNPEWVRGHVMDADKFLTQNTPKFEKVDLGGRVQVIDVNPVTNPQIRGTQLDKTASPEAMMTDARMRQEGALNRGVTMRGQNLTDARARETAQGTQKEQVADQKKIADANDVLQLLDEAETILPKSTGSYAGAVYDVGARTFGIAPEGAQAAAKLKAIQGLLVSKMPKMSGPQSDKDVQLYREMAGQIGDPTIPIQTRKAAMDTIRSINERYVGVAPGSSNIPPMSSPPGSQKPLDRIPSPSQVPKGAIITDTQTGKRLQSDGQKWIRL